MKKFFHQTGNNSLCPIMIKNNGKIYWTLYDNFVTDSLLHNEKNILYFLTKKNIDLFCEKILLKQIKTFVNMILMYLSKIRLITIASSIIGIC